MTDHYLPERGIAYRTNGNREGLPTLFFIHGLSGSSSAWYAYEPLLAPRYNLITYDLRGHGLSSRFSAPSAFRLSEFCLDAQALLAHLDSPLVTIVGHSFGTVIARELLRVHPEYAHRAILLAPLYGVERLARTKLARPLAAALASLVSLLPVSRRASRVDYTPFRGGGDLSPSRMAADIGAVGVHTYLWTLQEQFRYPGGEWSEFSNLPVALMHGAQDHFMPVRYAQALKAALPTAELTILPHGNHMLVNNNVREVAELIQRFVRE